MTSRTWSGPNIAPSRRGISTTRELSHHRCAIMVAPRILPRPSGLVGPKGRHVRLTKMSARQRPRRRAMKPWSTWLPTLGGVSARQVRAEAFFLGNRYRGAIVEGARQSLAFLTSVTPVRPSFGRSFARRSGLPPRGSRHDQRRSPGHAPGDRLPEMSPRTSRHPRPRSASSGWASVGIRPKASDWPAPRRAAAHAPRARDGPCLMAASSV